MIGAVTVRMPGTVTDAALTPQPFDHLVPLTGNYTVSRHVSSRDHSVVTGAVRMRAQVAATPLRGLRSQHESLSKLRLLPAYSISATLALRLTHSRP